MVILIALAALAVAVSLAVILGPIESRRPPSRRYPPGGGWGPY